MNEKARIWLASNFLCTEGDPETLVRTRTDNTGGVRMARQTFVCQDAEDTFWLGTADLDIPGLRILEDGEGVCMLQLPEDPAAREACLDALYAARTNWPAPMHIKDA